MTKGRVAKNADPPHKLDIDSQILFYYFAFIGVFLSKYGIIFCAYFY
jgi:hypothetical protein